MSAARPGTAILGAIAAAVVALWLSYAVAAGLMQAGGGTGDTPQAPSEAAPVGLALTPAPELRVRPALLKRAAASAAAATAPPAPAAAAARAKTEPAKPAPAMSAPGRMTHAPSPAATPAPAAPIQSAPAPRPAAKPKPTVAAQPKQPAAPDFDDASPSGFDNAG